MINKYENKNNLDYTTSAETVVAANTSGITDPEMAFADFLVTDTDFYSDFYSDDAPWLWID